MPEQRVCLTANVEYRGFTLNGAEGGDGTYLLTVTTKDRLFCCTFELGMMEREVIGTALLNRPKLKRRKKRPPGG